MKKIVMIPMNYLLIMNQVYTIEHNGIVQQMKVNQKKDKQSGQRLYKETVGG